MYEKKYFYLFWYDCECECVFSISVSNAKVRKTVNEILTDDLFGGRHENSFDMMEDLHHGRLDGLHHVAPVRRDCVGRFFQHALDVSYERNVHVPYQLWDRYNDGQSTRLVLQLHLHYIIPGSIRRHNRQLSTTRNGDKDKFCNEFWKKKVNKKYLFSLFMTFALKGIENDYLSRGRI